MILNAAGIRIGNVTRVDTDGVSTAVLYQSLAAGSTVPRGSSIDLNIVREKESEANSVELIVPLPNTDSSVTMSATLNGNTVISESVVPSQLGGYWQFAVLGEGLGTVSIYYDGQLYRAYSVNFLDKTSVMVTDYSDQFGG